MRRQLILVFAAIAAMVAIAFVVPLGILVRTTAEDRAIDAARADAASIVPTLVSDGSRQQLELAVASTPSGQADRLTVVTATGWTVGPDIDMSSGIDAALERGASSISEVDGGVEVIAAVAAGDGELSAIRVFVPDGDLRRGQSRAWTALGAVAVTLVALAVAVADRLARTIVRPTQELAAAAHRLGDGDLSSKVEPAGPPELVELSGAFNTLGSRVSSMLDRERELVAELSHRLRTPLTKLRLRIDQVDDAALTTQLHADIDDVTRVVNELIAEARSSLSNDDARCDAASIVAERVAFWSVLAEDTERELTFDPVSTALIVPTTAGALEAAVDVLIENVFAHTDDGLPFAVGVDASADATAEVVRIWVADAGDGIDVAMTERGASGGASTGLGLDIARSTAEAAGGSMAITPSSLGGGEVSMLLPRVDGGAT